MPDLMDRRATSASIPTNSKSSVKPLPIPKLSEGGTPIESALKSKRFSLVHMPSKQERRVTIRPYESFRERKEDKKDSITFGYAALSTNEDESRRDLEMEDGRPVSPSPSIFSIYGDEPGPSTICEQPVGAQADVFIASLGEKKLNQIKKYLDSTPREEHMYFLWVKDTECNKITVISIKTLENHLKNDSRVRRVKWRHLSSERVSIYRYSLPAITYEKSKMCKECMCRHKKLCLLLVWLAFVLFLCLVVVLGSLSPDDRTHPFAHNQSRTIPPQSLLLAQQQPPHLSNVLMNTSLVG
ncbi:Ras-associating domain-containing protein [Caenorhabditis elegans]|uniref:Ras-associating domain-containing protein n=1 Tax=Caenorhabditis elegans TaxID=6239 RepID=Q9TYQ7_CAEEL|nr:Ras-associating domain-containing protein [Caenorhabditis elegans]CCD63384.3 Ras-associating domain-containing protein [Caenorhabditis elegans]|eukprot:NP_500888.3 Uncharacterized protein CELE_H04M03.12 [Caenorhabditis elegans]